MTGRRGFTLAELMIGLAITAMIGSALSAMLISVSTGTEERADVRRLNVRHKLVSSRINAAIRESRMVLAEGTGFAVLWIDDSRENGLPNLSEIGRIDWNGWDSELWAYRAPAGLAAVDDTLYGFSSDFESITWSLMDTADFPGELWATNVTAWTYALDTTVTQDASLMSYQLVIEDQGASSTTSHCANLRGR